MEVCCAWFGVRPRTRYPYLDISEAEVVRRDDNYSGEVTIMGHELSEWNLEALRKNIRYIIVVGERKGNPSLLRIYSVGYPIEYRRVLKHIASIVLSGVRLSRESPSSTRVFNPETIFLDINECISDQCLLFADMMYKIFNRVLHEKPDVEVKLCDLDTCFKIEFRNRIGRQCGPVIKVTKVVVYEGMD